MDKAIVGTAKASGGLLAVGYVFSTLGGLIGLFIGAHLWRSKVRTPSGTREFKYDEASRNHGRIMFWLAAGATLVWFGIRASLG